LFGRLKNHTNTFAGPLKRPTGIQAGLVWLVIFLMAPIGVCNGELGVEVTGFSLLISANSNAAKHVSANPNVLKNHPLGSDFRNRGSFTDAPDAEPLYLAVYLNSRMLAEVIQAQDNKGTIYFKLNEIAALVESAPPKNGNALATLEALEDIFPAQFTYSEKLQVLFIKGQGNLPIEKKWERERFHAMVSRNQITDDTPIIGFEYGLLGPPSFDLSAFYFKNGEERYNYSFKGASEALFGTAQIFGRGLENERLTDLRISWERFHPDWFVRVGDVVAPPIELVSQAEAGLGINFSTFPMENATQFDTETITGDLLNGWEVELYRGNTLLDFRKSDGSGRFIFRAIPLLFGENDIVLKFYGPQGQIRQESRPVNIGRSMAPPGKLWFRFSAIEQGENIFLGRDSQTRSHIKGFRGFGEVFYGLSPQLTLTASLPSQSKL